ncbi:MAG: glycosyltransferase family 4 protein [bacterium]|nr:glycosyltransferase family 4 protein [bacterium]
MKILQINTERTWRGGERQTLYTLEGLRAAGIETGLLCRRDYPMAQAAADLGISIHAVDGQAGAMAFLAGSGARAYDLLHAQTAKGQSLAVLTRPAHRRPLLYTRRVNFAPSGRLTLLKYRLTERTVAISRAIRDTMADFGIPDIEVISSTVKERQLDKLRAADFAAKHNLAGKRIIATTGDMVPQKDPVTMVETIGHLKRLRRDFVFLHFGNRQMIDQVAPRIRELDLENHYLPLGHHDRVEDFFLLFDVFLITSNETEGLCSSIYDAFIYRVPVVSTLAGGMYDSVADRGLTCGPREPECLAGQIDLMLNDPAQAQILSDKAYQWARASVTIPAITERYLAVYNDMIGGR